MSTALPERLALGSRPLVTGGVEDWRSDCDRLATGAKRLPSATFFGKKPYSDSVVFGSQSTFTIRHWPFILAR